MNDVEMYKRIKELRKISKKRKLTKKEKSEVFDLLTSDVDSKILIDDILNDIIENAREEGQ